MPAQTPEEEKRWFLDKIKTVKGRGAKAKKAHYQEEIKRIDERIERARTGRQTTYAEYEDDMRARMGASTSRKSSGSKTGGRRRRRFSRRGGKKTKRGGKRTRRTKSHRRARK